MLMRVVAPHFVAGVVVELGGPPDLPLCEALYYGRVIEAAPILHWSVGRIYEHLWSYAQRKGWQIEIVG